MNKLNVQRIVYEYDRKHEEGFTPGEVDDLLQSHFPNIDRQKYDHALRGSTCVMRDGEYITYPHDVTLAITCALENREPTGYEWD